MEAFMGQISSNFGAMVYLNDDPTNFSQYQEVIQFGKALTFFNAYQPAGKQFKSVYM